MKLLKTLSDESVWARLLSERLVQQVKMQLNERPLSLKELVEQTKIEQKLVYRIISSLHRRGKIVQFRDPDGVRRYRLNEEP